MSCDFCKHARKLDVGTSCALQPRRKETELQCSVVEWLSTTDGDSGCPGFEASDEFRDKFAALCHEQWSGWMKYLFNRCDRPIVSEYQDGVLVPRPFVERWQRQMRTRYADLSTEEQDSDRREADKFVALLRELGVL